MKTQLRYLVVLEDNVRIFIICFPSIHMFCIAKQLEIQKFKNYKKNRI
jgi:hypothetical protein